jgi:hypothetical protein
MRYNEFNRKTADIDTSVNETIRKVGTKKWRLYSGKGKNLGTFDSLGAAKKHEGEVQYFKHMKESEGEIKVPTEDGIGWQDIRLLAGEGKLSQKTIKQAIEIIRKQRKK